MRHCKVSRKFKRSSSHRSSMFRNLINSLVKYERIKTTLIKSKMLRSKIEKLVTIAKKDNIANRRLLFSRIRNNETVSKMFKEIGPRFINRPGGYTRILKLSFFTSKKAYIEFIK